MPGAPSCADKIRLATDADLPEVRVLCRAYRDALIAATSPSLIDLVYPPQTYEALLADLPGPHARPEGAILVGPATGALQACGMLVKHTAQRVEIKRVFVSEGARGQGLARALCVAAMDQARADGYEEMVLDTLSPVAAAIRLYESLGFAPIAPFHSADPATRPHLRFFWRAL